MQATELARERDNLNGQVENLRNELVEAKREVAGSAVGCRRETVPRATS
jgi:hypothetical protein